MNISPCITNKCLKYPVCKYKKFIECNELSRYCINQITDHHVHNYSMLLKFMQKTLPNLKEVPYRKH